MVGGNHVLYLPRRGFYGEKVTWLGGDHVMGDSLAASYEAPFGTP